MYAGGLSSWRSKGIYLYKFHSATGKTEAAGVAAGWLWQSNIDALAGSPGRIFAQLRAEWPNVKKMLLGAQNPGYFALHPNGRYLYAADRSAAGTISAYRADAVTGKLTMLNTKPSAGSEPAYATIDSTGRNLLVANFGGTVAVLPIDATGRLHDAASVVTPKGVGPDEARQPHPHCVTMSPDNRFALVAEYGLDEILAYRFDADKGTLTPNDPPFVKLPAGTEPRHLAFHPNGNFAYVIGESGSSVTAMHWNAQRGALTVLETLSTVPSGFQGKNAGAEVLVHPNGRFLYGSNRGDNSIAAYAIDPEKGTLTPFQYASTRGKTPTNFLIDPTGNYLFAENVVSGNVVQFRIDQQSGELAPMASFDVSFPVCLRFLPARQP
jgi:6-phosphogluconolactonase